MVLGREKNRKRKRRKKLQTALDNLMMLGRETKGLTKSTARVTYEMISSSITTK